ncbi:MAG: ABC transporter fused permease/ATP-binding protein [Cyclobacteriaceae bacterium]|jgi:ABC transporter fused permease/ATP-binding protein
MAEEEKKKISKDGLKKLFGIFSYVWPHKWSFIGGLMLLVVSSSLMLAFPKLAGQIVNVAQGQQEELLLNVIRLESLNQVALVLLVILALQAFFSFFRVILFAKVSERALAEIRTDLYRHVITLPMAFFDKRRTGELISRITSDTATLQDTLSVTLAELVRQVVVLVVGISAIFMTTPKLSFFMLGTFPIIILLAMVFGRFIRKLSKKTQDQLASANVVVEETIQSIASVKAFTSELLETMRYRKSIDEVVKTALKGAWFRAAFISFMIFMVFGGIVGIMWYGGQLVASGEMNSGDLISFVLYTVFIGGSIAGLGNLIGQIQRSIGASERILEILEEADEASMNPSQPVSLRAGAFAFESVQFSYPTRPEVEVLRGISFAIKPGEKVALVGHSGAGKSTIAQLMMRYYEPTAGNLSMNGEALQKGTVQDLRSKIGVVPQEVLLFGGTLLENIRYGKPEATMAEVQEAAKKAYALEFIEGFPEGFDTLVGERGVKLSGGQRQRIAIARAILKDPEFLILDEATSALDAESERLVQDALQVLMEGRTTLVIAHRLATIKSVDRIMVLKEGQIIEEGSHQDLLEQKGAYHQFIELQLLAD